MKTVQFKEWSCEVQLLRYNNNRTAIQLVDKDDGEPIAIGTVNIPDEDIQDDEVIIKDYSENEGMAQALQEAGIIGPELRRIPIGFVTVPIHKLLIK